MNARVFVLVLVTGLFMAVWNSDQRRMNVRDAAHAPANIIDCDNTLSETLHYAAAVEPPVIISNSAAGDTEESVKPEAADETEDREAAELEVMLVAAVLNNVDQLPSIGTSRKSRVAPLLLEEIESLQESIPTFLAVDDVIIFGNPADESVEDRISAEVCEDIDAEAIAVSDSAIPAGRNQLPAGITLLLNAFDRLVTESAVRIEAASAKPSVSDAAASAATAFPANVLLPKDARSPIIPVPCELAAGTWIVLSQSGETFRIAVERSSAGPESADNFHIRSAPDGDRWCFVRANEPTLTAEQSSESGHISTDFWSPAENQ